LPGNYSSGSITFSADVLDPLHSDFDYIVNAVAIGDDGAGGPDQNPGDNIGTAVTPVDARTDLQVRKVDRVTEVAPGDTIGYTIRYTNTGTNTANGVTLTDTVPSGTTFNAGMSTIGWNCPLPDAGTTCTFDVGTMPGNYSSGAIIFVVDVLSPAAADQAYVVNAVAIGDDGAGGPDQHPGDNIGTAVAQLIAAPDLQISKDDGVEFVGPGGTIQYTIVYTNAGNRDTASTIISETVPANTTFDAGNNPDGFTCSPSTGEAGANCTKDVGAVPGNGGNGSVTFVVTVDSPLTPGETQTTNYVDIYDGSPLEPDANPNDNSAEHTTLLNVPPEIVGSSPPTQTLQYSDLIATVTFTATDPGPDDLTLSAASLPNDLALSSASCSDAAGGGKECTWTLSGQMLEAVGTYAVEVTASDGVLTSDPTTINITVEHEDATVAFDAANEVTQPVDPQDGLSSAFSIAVLVNETLPDLPAGSNLPGDISEAVVTMKLEPVAPGNTVTGVCTPDTSNVSGSAYTDELIVNCAFDDVPVNIYTVEVEVVGDYYVGSGLDMLIVYDPALGFTTGGGWFYWPGTTDRTTFGYMMQYNKKATQVKGNLLLIRHLPDGTHYRIKSNAINGLALGTLPGDGDWATFAGKGNYSEPGWLEPEGNHRFLVYVEDHGEPGAGNDRFWIQVVDKKGDPTMLTMDGPAEANSISLEGGNIIVPHQGEGKGNKNLTEQAAASTADEPLASGDEMAIFLAGDSYESLIVDVDGQRLGLVDGAPLAEIPESAYLAEPYDESTGMELFWLPADGFYDIEIRGRGDGQVQVQVLMPKNSQFATIYVFEDLDTSSSSVARLQMSKGQKWPMLANDFDGDGRIDQFLQAVDEIRVHLSS
jgi:uncharacterized repeat protein (TIGR01451 family)